MKEWIKHWWPAIKWILATVILLFVGVRIVGDLRQLEPNDLTLRPGWLVLSAMFYLAGLGCSGLFWYRLLWRFDQQPRLTAALRAFYISQLGKYVPGKAVALIVRGSLIRSQNVSFGVAAIAAFYEVLTFMAAGGLVAAILFAVQPFDGLPWNPVLVGLLLLGLLCIPLAPGVFNRLVKGLVKRFPDVHALKLPVLRIGTLLQGVAWTSAGWVLIGLSMWALMPAVVPNPPELTWRTGVACIAMVSLSYVIGFSVLVVPGGIGVREFLLLQLLSPILIASAAAAVVVALRLLWTVSELLIAAALYWGCPALERQKRSVRT